MQGMLSNFQNVKFRFLELKETQTKNLHCNYRKNMSIVFPQDMHGSIEDNTKRSGKMMPVQVNCFRRNCRISCSQQTMKFCNERHWKEPAWILQKKETLLEYISVQNVIHCLPMLSVIVPCLPSDSPPNLLLFSSDGFLLR